MISIYEKAAQEREWAEKIIKNTPILGESHLVKHINRTDEQLISRLFEGRISKSVADDKGDSSSFYGDNANITFDMYNMMKTDDFLDTLSEVMAIKNLSEKIDRIKGKTFTAKIAISKDCFSENNITFPKTIVYFWDDKKNKDGSSRYIKTTAKTIVFCFTFNSVKERLKFKTCYPSKNETQNDIDALI